CIRAAARGGLAGIKPVTMKLREPRGRAGRKLSMAAVPSDRSFSLTLRATRANVYNVPTHNPTITRLYSVWVPVWAAEPQKQNMSTSRPRRQIAKTSVTIVVVDRDLI